MEYFYAGLRPLVDDGSGDTYGASRRAELVDHGKDDRLDGLFSAIGGKWTTSRHLAEQVVDKLVARLGTKTRDCDTATAPLPAKPIPDVATAIRDEMAQTLEDVVLRRTGIGQFGPPAELDAISRTMAAALGWSEERRAQEIASLMRRYQTQDAA